MSGDRPDPDETRRLRDLSKKATKGGDVIADSESSQESGEEQKPESHGSFLRGILAEAKGESKATAPPKNDQKDQKTKTSQKQQESHPSTNPVEPFENHTNDQRATGHTSVGLCDKGHVRLRCHWSYHDSTNSKSSWRLEQVNFTDDSSAREAHKKCAFRKSAQLLDSLARYMREDLQNWFEDQGRRLTRTSPPTVANLRDALRPLVTQFLNGLSGIRITTVFAPTVETPVQARARSDYLRKRMAEKEERAKADKLAIARQAEKREAAQRKHNEKDIKEAARGRVTIKPSREDQKVIEAIRRAERAEARKADQQKQEEEKKQRQNAAVKGAPTTKSQKLKTITEGSQESSRSPSPWNDRLRSSRRSRPIVRDSEDSDSASPPRPSRPSKTPRSTPTKIQDSNDSDSVKAPRSSKPSPSTKKAPAKTSKSVVSSTDQPAAKKTAKASASTAGKTTKAGEAKKSTQTPAGAKTRETTTTTKVARSSETKRSETNESTKPTIGDSFGSQVVTAFGGSTATTQEATTSTLAGPVDADVEATIEATTSSVEIKQQDTQAERSEVINTTEVVESGSEEGEIVVKSVTDTVTATASAPTESQPSHPSPVPSPKSASGYESDWETVSSSTSSSSSGTKRKRAAATEEAEFVSDSSSQRGDTSPSKKRKTFTPPDSPAAITASPVLIPASETAAPPSEAGSSRSSKSSSSKKRKATWTKEDGEITISPSRTKRSRSEDGKTDPTPGSGATEGGADDTARPPEPSEGGTLIDRLRAQG
ncbi:hypothetical protein E8E13_005537 [Curvularia kusanoi]|uniref:Uncharacterized protein n=1 Tax=Curvularia kusanoi TaxID=90978 RepID=A0A9P4W9E8_CURKU|nr:hypothetical protein E8E13_005537 [Curvularia kusanoi]